VRKNGSRGGKEARGFVIGWLIDAVDGYRVRLDLAGGALLLEAGVVVVTGADAGEVVAWSENWILDGCLSSRQKIHV
jgi:hypothetical protein